MQYSYWRRFAELVLTLTALPFAVPLGLVAALAIAADSRGGVLFLQIRPGKNGKPFRMIKFRTMTARQEGVFQLTRTHDTRLTRVGKWLRKTHLDEIPQLWHVLRGEMSLIGPRPVPMELYAEYLEKIPRYDERHQAPPGISGLGQVLLGYTNTLEGEKEKWRYDVYYIRHRSAALDAWILWATLAGVMGWPAPGRERLRQQALDTKRLK